MGREDWSEGMFTFALIDQVVSYWNILKLMYKSILLTWSERRTQTVLIVFDHHASPRFLSSHSNWMCDEKSSRVSRPMECCNCTIIKRKWQLLWLPARGARKSRIELREELAGLLYNIMLISFLLQRRTSGQRDPPSRCLQLPVIFQSYTNSTSWSL